MLKFFFYVVLFKNDLKAVMAVQFNVVLFVFLVSERVLRRLYAPITHE